jgi:hypothetical protein
MAAFGQQGGDGPAVGLGGGGEASAEVEDGGQAEVVGGDDGLVEAGCGGGDVEGEGLVGVVEDLAFDLGLEEVEQVAEGNGLGLCGGDVEGVSEPGRVLAIGEEKDVGAAGVLVGRALEAYGEEMLLGIGSGEVNNQEGGGLGGKKGRVGKKGECYEREQAQQAADHGSLLAES